MLFSRLNFGSYLKTIGSSCFMARTTCPHRRALTTCSLPSPGPEKRRWSSISDQPSSSTQWRWTPAGGVCGDAGEGVRDGDEPPPHGGSPHACAPSGRSPLRRQVV